MPNKSIVLVGDKAVFSDEARAAIAAKGYTVEFFDRSAAEHSRLNWAAYDLLAIEHSSKVDPFKICDSARQANPSLKTIFVTANSPIDVIEERVGRLYPDNVMTSTTILYTSELVQTIVKMFADQPFGFGFYLDASADVHTIRIDDSKKKGEYIETIIRYAIEQNVRSRIIGSITEVLDEMIMNVIYDAPTDGRGRHIYAHRSRTEHVVLTPKQAATLSYVHHDGLFGLSMADPFGSLTRDKVVYYLRKCYGRGSDQIDTKKGGAGLGIFKIFDNVNQLVINISPGRRTEFLVFISTRGNEFKNRAQSFNLFVKE